MWLSWFYQLLNLQMQTFLAILVVQLQPDHISDHPQFPFDNHVLTPNRGWHSIIKLFVKIIESFLDVLFFLAANAIIGLFQLPTQKTYLCAS